MSTLEYLTFLTPKGIRLDQSGRKRILKWEDVAAAMGMGTLSEEAYYLGRAKFLGDAPAGAGLHQIMTERCADLMSHRKWKCKRDLSADLAKVACFEALSNETCEHCQGTGRGIGGHCEHCGGRGRARVPDANRYTLLNMDKRNWERRWRARYEEIYQMLTAAEDELSHHLAIQLN